MILHPEKLLSFQSIALSRDSPTHLILSLWTFVLLDYPYQVGESQNTQVLMILPWDLTPVFIDSEVRDVRNAVS